MAFTPGPRPLETAQYTNDEGANINRYIAVIHKLGGNPGLMELPAAANAQVVGLTEYKTEDGEDGSVVTKGYWKGTAGAAIAIGARLVVNGALGKLKTDPATPLGVSELVGFAETAATADGDIIIVRLAIQKVYNP